MNEKRIPKKVSNMEMKGRPLGGQTVSRGDNMFGCISHRGKNEHEIS
jgi:hypothetical protein